MSRRKTRGGQRTIDWKNVGRRLRELRGFETTQAELAHRLGVSQGYYSLAERGEREIGPEILIRISRQFGESIVSNLIAISSFGSARGTCPGSRSR